MEEIMFVLLQAIITIWLKSFSTFATPVSLEHTIATYCFQNQMVYVTIGVNNSSLNQDHQKMVLKLIAHDLRVRLMELEKVKNVYNRKVDSLLLLTHKGVLQNETDFQNTFTTIHSARRRSVVWSFIEDLTQSDEDTFINLLALNPKNAYFHWIYQKQNEVHVKQIVTLSNSTKVIINHIQDTNGTFQEVQNLQGLHVICLSMPYLPFLEIEGCNEHGRNCHTTGMVADFQDVICKLLNCTWECQIPTEHGWGVRPISGPFNKSGVWGGAMGGIINNQYMIGMANWVWNDERDDFLDFVSTGFEQNLLALTPKPTELDMGLFIRPFTNEAWKGIMATFGIIMCCIVIPYAMFYNFENTIGYIIASTTSWIFFVLVNAYYGGALTMFFTTEISIPFINIYDVMAAYPDWKLKGGDVNDVIYVYKAQDGDTAFQEFYNRFKNNPSENTYHTVKDGLLMLQDELAVLHISHTRLGGFFKANPFWHQNLKLFGKEKPTLYSNMLPKDSPLTPFFRQTMAKVVENGLREHITSKWEGKDIHSGSATENMILTAGQVLLLLIIVSILYGFVLMIVCCELVHKKCH